MKRLVSILAIALVGSCQPTAAHAAFGIDHFDVTFTEADTSTAAQAGSHPFAMTTSLGVNFSGEETEGRLKELLVDLPPGLLLDTNAIPRCLEEEFLDPEEGCPRVAAVGTSSSSFIESGHSGTALVYNLVPPEGVLLRLGFRVADAANVFVDFGLSSAPPYNPIAVAGDWPETVDVFATDVQLWGVPADPAHDKERGGPVESLRRPFLTLPTSCEGPQETFYEALSWEGDEVWGTVFTHGGAGEPLGFLGCRRLAFNPSLSAHLTTEAAQSPTGLDLSLEMLDAGLFNPAGIAESQIRDLVVALPGGMRIGPSLASPAGSCSEADLEAEAPETGPGEGCPETSKIGTVEAESPLVEGESIGGSVFRATPKENFAGDAAAALYLVLKNPGLGVVITQPVGLEEDPETDQLIASVEEMPQLPLSHLHLHLDDGESGTLVSPTFCGSYTTEDNFTTWSGEGPFRVTSSFPIVSGPNGGPCPTGTHEVQLGETAGSSSAGGAAPPSSGPGKPHPHLSTRRRCRKGRHRVLRHGRVRCSRKPQGKHDRHHRRSR